MGARRSTDRRVHRHGQDRGAPRLRLSRSPCWSSPTCSASPRRTTASSASTWAACPSIDADDATRVTLDPLAFLQAQFAGYVEDRRREPRDDVLTKLATGHLPRRVDPRRRHGVPHGHLPVRGRAGHHRPAHHRVAADHRRGSRGPGLPASRRRAHPELRRGGAALRGRGQAGRAAPPGVSTTIAGVDIPAGSTIAIFPQAANRDPARFEAPDEFRPDRPNANEHLAFGRGVHACPGGPLSRIEARVSIERFLARTTDIRIDESVHGPAGDRHFEFEPIYILHGLKELHLELTPAEDVG